MAKESVLTADEKESLKLDKFIFHIILAKEDVPEYLDSVQLDNESQRAFFRERILHACEGTQYCFADKDNSTFKGNCDDLLAAATENQFVQKSKTVASDFCWQHGGTMSDGVFIVATVQIQSNGTNVDLVALLKIDHSTVYQYKQQSTAAGRKATITEIKNSFVEHKNAIQKWAVIDPSNHYGWDVLARQRHTPDGVAEYFESFLQAEPRETASKLTNRAVSTVFAWARELDSSSIPEDQTPPDYRNRAIEYMKTSDEFDTDEFVKAIVSDEDRNRRKEVRDLLKQELQNQGIAGQTFEPKPNSIPGKQKKGRLTTAQNVTVEWPGGGTARESGITIIADGNNSYTVTITTTNVSYPD